MSGTAICSKQAIEVRLVNNRVQIHGNKDLVRERLPKIRVMFPLGKSFGLARHSDFDIIKNMLSNFDDVTFEGKYTPNGEKDISKTLIIYKDGAFIKVKFENRWDRDAKIKETKDRFVTNEDYLRNDLSLSECLTELNKSGANLVISEAVKLKMKEIEILTDTKFEIKALKIPLWPYQRIGARFLSSRGRALLADDIGTGKTAQAIAGAAKLMEDGKVEKVLIFTLASVLEHWANEIEKFTPFKSVILTGNPKSRYPLYNEDVEFYIMSYEMVLRDFDIIKGMGFDLIILDEAQKVKNHKARRTKYIKFLKSTYLFMTTGTPIQNKLDDLHCIMEFINPAILGSWYSFDAKHIDRNPFGGVNSYRDLQIVHGKIKPHMLRRLRSEVLPDLPDVVENVYRVDMTRNQDKIYKIISDELIKTLSDEDTNIQVVEAKFMMLRMVCDTPEVFLESDARTVNQFKKYVIKEETGKIKELKRLLEEDLKGKRVVIFTEWKRVLDILDTHIDRPKAYIHGGLSAKERGNQIKKFRSVGDCVMLSTDAGSTGLDGLQVASNVINFELPFSVTTLSQRVGRLHRAGQRDSVNAIHLVCRDTVEEGVLSKLRAKKNLFNQVIEGKSKELSFGKEQYRKLLLEA